MYMMRSCISRIFQLKPSRIHLVARPASTSSTLTDDRIDELACTSLTQESILEQFHSLYNQQIPVILRGYAQNYPAIEKWKSLDYLLQVVGPDSSCDVEVGSYNQGERLTLSFEGYIYYLRLWQEMYASSGQESPPDQLLYLAQNDLQSFPSLLPDIQPPELCFQCGDGKLYSSMLWLGPRGCISPLHYDPLDNLLVQLVGRKRVTLITSDTNPQRLYVGAEHEQQYNTSAVNVEDPDSVAHPLFFGDGITTNIVRRSTSDLLPGDALFIPSKWWHHVRSLDLSISVNFWWR
jgi:[protein]-arginine 3-hydroxylase / protease